MMVPRSAAANSSASSDFPLAVGPAIRMTGAGAGVSRIGPASLPASLRIGAFVNAIEEAYLMLSSARFSRCRLAVASQDIVVRREARRMRLDCSINGPAEDKSL